MVCLVSGRAWRVGVFVVPGVLREFLVCLMRFVRPLAKVCPGVPGLFGVPWPPAQRARARLAHSVGLLRSGSEGKKERNNADIHLALLRGRKGKE